MIQKYGAVLMIAFLALSILPLAVAAGPSGSLARSQYATAKESFIQSKNMYQSARQDYMTARGQKGEMGSLEEAKTFLSNAADTSISYLEMTRAYVAEQDSLSNQAAILAKLDSDITSLEAKKAEIASASTRQELQSVAVSIKQEWQRSKVDAKWAVGEALSDKVNLVIMRGDTVSDTLANEIAKAESKGKDVTEANALLASFNSKLELAKEKQQSAEDSFAQADGVADADGVVREGYQFVLDANRYVRDAYMDAKAVRAALI